MTTEDRVEEAKELLRQTGVLQGKLVSLAAQSTSLQGDSLLYQIIGQLEVSSSDLGDWIRIKGKAQRREKGLKP